MTTNAQKARTRNWQKMRVMGMTLDVSVLTDDERALWRLIQGALNELKNNWDANTEQFLGHRLPPFKCEFCGKRSSAFYSLEGKIVCYKHLIYFRDGRTEEEPNR